MLSLHLQAGCCLHLLPCCPAVLRGPSDQDFKSTWKLKLQMESAAILQSTMGPPDWRCLEEQELELSWNLPHGASWVFFFNFYRQIYPPWAKSALVMCRSHLGGSPVCLWSLLTSAWSAWSGRGSWPCSCCPPTPAQVGCILGVKVCLVVWEGLYSSCHRLRLIL